MNYEKLNEIVMSTKGSTFAGLDTVTNVSLTGGKKNPMQGRVTKKTTGSNVMLFANITGSAYENMVKRRMVAEGKDPETFELKPRAWGTRIGNSPFIEHKDKKYLECFFISGGKTEYFLDGEPIAKEDIEGLKEPKEKEVENNKTETKSFSNNDLENKVVIRTYSLDSIERITIKNEVLTE